MLLPILVAASLFAAKPDPARAESLRRSAQRLLQERSFAKAISMFEEAERAAPDPKNLLEIARAYDRWGEHCVQSLDAFRRFFAACKACELAERAGDEVLLVENKCSSEVAFSARPSGTIVRVDDERVDRVTPFSMQLRPGKHRLYLRRFGYAAKVEVLEVPPSTSIRFEGELVRAAGVADRDLVIDVPRSVERPAAASGSDAGSSGGAAAAGVRDAAVVAAPEPAPSALTIAALSAGIAGGIAGTAFAIASANDVDAELAARHSPNSTVEEIESHRSDARRDAVLAHVAFGVSIAGFAAAAALYLIDASDVPPTSSAPGRFSFAWGF